MFKKYCFFFAFYSLNRTFAESKNQKKRIW